LQDFDVSNDYVRYTLSVGVCKRTVEKQRTMEVEARITSKEKSKFDTITNGSPCKLTRK